MFNGFANFFKHFLCLFLLQSELHGKLQGVFFAGVFVIAVHRETVETAMAFAGEYVAGGRELPMIRLKAIKRNTFQSFLRAQLRLVLCCLEN